MSSNGLNDEIKRLQSERKILNETANPSERIGLNSRGQFDSDLYGDLDKDQYVSSLPVDDEDEEEDRMEYSHPSTKKRINPSRSLINESLGEADGSLENHYREQYGSGLANTRIADRENEVRNFLLHFLFSSLSLHPDIRYSTKPDVSIACCLPREEMPSVGNLQQEVIKIL
jgi:hypothetical protein